MTGLTVKRPGLLQRAATVVLVVALGSAVTACSSDSTPSGELKTPTSTVATAGPSTAGTSTAAVKDASSDGTKGKGVAKLDIIGGPIFTFTLDTCAISAAEVVASGADESVQAWFDADLSRADNDRGASSGGVMVDVGASTADNDSEDVFVLNATDEKFTLESMGKDAVAIRGEISHGNDVYRIGRLAITCTG